MKLALYDILFSMHYIIFCRLFNLHDVQMLIINVDLQQIVSSVKTHLRNKLCFFSSVTVSVMSDFLQLKDMKIKNLITTFLGFRCLVSFCHTKKVLPYICIQETQQRKLQPCNLLHHNQPGNYTLVFHFPDPTRLRYSRYYLDLNHE